MKIKNNQIRPGGSQSETGRWRAGMSLSWCALSRWGLTLLVIATATSGILHASSPDPRPRILIIGGRSACSWDSGLSWPDCLIEERLDWNIEVEASPEWGVPEMAARLDAILDAHAEPSLVLLATCTMDAKVFNLKYAGIPALKAHLTSMIERIRARWPAAQPVVITPLPVVKARLRSTGLRLFSNDGEQNVRLLSEAYREAATAAGATVMDLYDHVWKMDRHPLQPDAKPQAPGFVMGSLGCEMRDWGPPLIMPWVISQIEALNPKPSDPARYAAWREAWHRQSAETMAAAGGGIRHGPALTRAGGKHVVPVERLQGDSLDLLVAAEEDSVEFQPCISMRHAPLTARSPWLQVITDRGTINFRVRSGHWQIIQEKSPQKPFDHHQLYTTAHLQDFYHSKVDATPGARMLHLTRFLLAPLRGHTIQSATLTFSTNRPLLVFPIEYPDKHWHPGRATWTTRDGRLPWTGTPNGDAAGTVFLADPQPIRCAVAPVSGPPGLDKTGPDANAFEPIARDAAIRRDRERIEKQLAEHGQGDWSKWATTLSDFRAELVATTDGTPYPWPAKHGFYFQGAAAKLLARESLDTKLDGAGALDVAVDLNRQLRSMGIDLILVPIPDKLAIYPDYLLAKTPDHRNVNTAMLRWIHDLLQNDVETLDLYTLFRETRMRTRDTFPLYYDQDSHWLNVAAQMTARELAPRLRRYDFVRESLANGNRFAGSRFQREDEKADVLRRITGGGIDRRSPILLTGDSFAGYHDAHAAHLPLQVAYETGHPVDYIMRMGFGMPDAAITFARDPRTIEGKKVVVVTFIARFLSASDSWRPMPLVARARTATPAAELDRLPVTAKVASISERPPERSEYKDFFMLLYVTDMKDAQGQPVGLGDGVFAVLAMKDHKHLPVAKIEPSQSVSFKITTWNKVEPQYGTVQSGSLHDASLMIEKERYFAEP